MVRTDFHQTARMKRVSLEYGPGARFWMSAEEVVSCSLRRLSSRQVIVIPGLGNGIFGRLAQMPVLQPLMQWITRGPRLAPSAAQSLEDCAESAFGIAKVPESAAAS